MKRNYKMIECKVMLDAEEIEAAAETLAKKTLELDEIELQKKASNASFKERAERISGEIRTASRLYRDKFDMRDVECEVVKDYEFGEVHYVRTDTFEVAKREMMSHAERQMHLDEITPDVEDEPEKSDDEIRRENETKRMMASEKSVH